MGEQSVLAQPEFTQPEFAQAYFIAESFSHSETVPIKDAVGEWRRPVRDGNYSFTHNRAEVGVRYGALGVGYQVRSDYSLEYSQDFAEFYHLTNNKLPLPVGRAFQLQMDAMHADSKGIRFSYELKMNNALQATLGATYLMGRAMTEGVLSGTATAIGEQDYDFDFYVNYFYSRDVLFEREVSRPSGAGYSVDALVAWDINRQWRVQLHIVDLLGRIYWENAPLTTAIATSDTKDFDEDGYVKFNPVLSGLESNQDFTQKLHPQTKLQISYSVNTQVDLIAKALDYAPARFFLAGVAWRLDTMQSINILYMFETDAVSLGYTNKFVTLEFVSDAFDINDAYTLGLLINAHIAID